MEQHIHESNLIEGYDRGDADESSLKAWDWLIKQERLTHDAIQHVQNMITRFQTDMERDWRGFYRSHNRVEVNVGHSKGLRADWVQQAMDNWLAEYPNHSPKDNHILFEKIHPFVDGNGRTGRMLMWYQEVKARQPATMIRSNEADRHYYYRWFK